MAPSSPLSFKKKQNFLEKYLDDKPYPSFLILGVDIRKFSAAA
jgi:hypothetical protein